MKHTISVLVENRFGVLARIAGLFSARGFNIDSLAVGETEDATISRMTIIVDAADERVLEQIKKQLNKLIDVITVSDLTKREHIDRELLLVKIGIDSHNKARLHHLAEKSRSLKVIQEMKDYAIAEITADQHTAKELLSALKEFGIKELVRTGRVAISI